MFELLTGKAPFTPKTVGGDRKEKMKELEDNVIKGKIDFPSVVSTKAKILIQRVLQKYPEMRPSATQILQDDWFKDFGLVNVVNTPTTISYETVSRDYISQNSNQDPVIVRAPGGPNRYERVLKKATTTEYSDRQIPTNNILNSRIPAAESDKHIIGSRRQESQERRRFVSPKIQNMEMASGNTNISPKQIVRTNSPIIIRTNYDGNNQPTTTTTTTTHTTRYQQNYIGGTTNYIPPSPIRERDQSPSSRVIINQFQKTAQGGLGHYNKQENQVIETRMVQTANNGFNFDKNLTNISPKYGNYQKPPSPNFTNLMKDLNTSGEGIAQIHKSES